MNRRVVVLLALVFSSSLVVGQGRGRPQTVPSQSRVYESSAVDTRLFFPQITHSISLRTISPENPIPFPDVIGGRGNRLPVGGVRSESRVAPGSFFPGIGATGWVPADPDLAVGPGHVVQVVNMSVAFFTKSGTKQLEQSAQTLFAGMGAFSFQFDPKCFYDRVHGRFVILFLEKDTPSVTSKLLVAVSDDDDPNGTWFRYRIEAKLNIGGNDFWIDYPGFGYNKDAYVANGNMFAFSAGGFGGVQFLVMPSAPMLSGGAVTVTSIRDGGGASAQAAEVIDPSQANVFAVSRRSGTTARIYALSNLTTVPTLNQVDIAIPAHAGPGGDADSTNGNTLDTIDARVFNAVWRGGRLLAAHNYQGTTLIGSRWYEFDTGTWPTAGTVTLVQSGGIQSSTLHRFDPAINKNATGKVSLLFTSSSTTVTADMTVAGRLSSDPLGTVGSPLVLESSVGDNYTRNRWGDYFGVDVDPVDDVTFWGVAMLVRADNSWTTSIHSWVVPGTTNHAADQFAWARGLTQSGTLASLAVDDNDYLVAKAGPVLFAGELPAQLVVETTAPSITLFGIDLTVIAKANTPGLSQKVEIWNWTTGQYDLLGEQAATGTDSVQNVSAVGPHSRYVDAATRKVRARVVWRQTGPVLLWPWQVSVDQVEWSITSA